MGKAVFNDIADGNDSGKPGIVDDRKMSEPSPRHPLHKLMDRITLFAGRNLSCHHLFDWLVAKLTTARDPDVVGKCVHNIPF